MIDFAKGALFAAIVSAAILWAVWPAPCNCAVYADRAAVQETARETVTARATSQVAIHKRRAESVAAQPVAAQPVAAQPEACANAERIAGEYLR